MVKENQPLSIPFELADAENDPITRSVERGSPKGVKLVQSKRTGQYMLSWAAVPRGEHSVRLVAIDAAGNRVRKTLTIEARRGEPGIFVSTEHEGGFELQAEANLLARAQTPVNFRVDLAVPAGQRFDLSIGLKEARGAKPKRLSVKAAPRHWNAPPNTFRVNVQFPSPGVYTGRIVAKNTSTGSEAELPLQFNVEPPVSLIKRNDRSRLYAVLNIHDTAVKTAPQWAEVQGRVRLNVTFRSQYGRGKPVSNKDPMIRNTTLEYVLYLPPTSRRAVDALPVRILSRPLTNGYRFTWDTTSVPDGSYVLGVRYLDGPHLSALRAQMLKVVVDNAQRGPRQGVQQIPVTGFFYDDEFATSDLPDWVEFSGERRPSRTHPFPYRFSPPATEWRSSPRSVIGDNSKWFVEALIHNNGTTYEDMPSFVRTRSGHVLSAGFYAQEGPTVEEAIVRGHPSPTFLLVLGAGAKHDQSLLNVCSRPLRQ